MFFSFFFILASEQLLYHVEYFLFIFSHLHPNTYIHGYSQSQYHSFLNVKLDKETIYCGVPSSFFFSSSTISKASSTESLRVRSDLPSTEKDAQPTINSEYTHWIKLNQMLLCWLISSLTEAVLAHVVGLTTSRDCWPGGLPL